MATSQTPRTRIHYSPTRKPCSVGSVSVAAEAGMMCTSSSVLRNQLYYVGLFGTYLCLNSSLNLINRWTLGFHFKFPVLLTMCHLFFSFIMLLPVQMFQKQQRSRQLTVISRQWRGLLAVGFLMSANIGLNNLSLVEISLSLNQILRASLPVVTAAVAVALEQKIPSRLEILALILLVSGVITAIYQGSVSGSSYGIKLCLAGVLCAAAMLTTSSRVLSEKLDVLQLAFATAPISCLVLLPLFVAKEMELFITYVQTEGLGVGWLVLLGSVTALTYNCVHYLLLQKTSAVTVTVLGEVKIVGLLLLSAAILPGESSQFTMSMMAGCACAVLGFCLYSHACMLSAGRGGAAADEGSPNPKQHTPSNSGHIKGSISRHASEADEDSPRSRLLSGQQKPLFRINAVVDETQPVLVEVSTC